MKRHDLDNDKRWEGSCDVAVPIDSNLRAHFSHAEIVNNLSEEVDKTDYMNKFYNLTPDQPWFSQVFTKVDWTENASHMLPPPEPRDQKKQSERYQKFIDLLVFTMARIKIPSDAE